MKKLLLLAALLAAAAAQAEILAVIPNKEGGKISFTTTKGDCSAGKVAMTYGTSNDTSLGCWLWQPELEAAVVRWSDGSLSTYPLSMMEKPKAPAAKSGGPSL
jgi:hypothetical protein